MLRAATQRHSAAAPLLLQRVWCLLQGSRDAREGQPSEFVASQALYKDMVEDYAHHADVLKRFKSARPPIEHLINMVPVLKPRAYSIASSPSMHADMIQLCVVTVDWNVHTTGELRIGEATGHMRARSLAGAPPPQPDGHLPRDLVDVDGHTRGLAGKLFERRLQLHLGFSTGKFDPGLDLGSTKVQKRGARLMCAVRQSAIVLPKDWVSRQCSLFYRSLSLHCPESFWTVLVLLLTSQRSDIQPAGHCGLKAATRPSKRG